MQVAELGYNPKLGDGRFSVQTGHEATQKSFFALPDDDIAFSQSPNAQSSTKQDLDPGLVACRVPPAPEALVHAQGRLFPGRPMRPS